MPASISKYLQDEYGVQIKNENPNGSFTVIDPDGNEMDMDVKGLMQEDFKEAGDTSTDVTALPVSSEDAPLSKSALSFGQQIGLAKVSKDSEKASYLEREFGKANVKKLDDGTYAVKGSDGLWSKGEADSGLATFLGKDAAATAGAMVGAEIGIGAGSVAGPLGAAVGGIAGAGIGAIVGKIANVKAAYDLGIRGDVDAKDIATELATEGLYAMAGQAVVPAAGLVLRGAKGLGQSIMKLKPSLSSENAKLAAVNWISTATDADPKLAATLWSNPDDVIKGVDEMNAWNRKASNVDMAGFDPLTTKQLDLTEATVKLTKKDMQTQYGNFVKANEKLFSDTHATVDELASRVMPALEDLGLTKEGRWLKDSERLEQVSPIWAGKDLAALKRVHSQLSSVMNKGRGIVPSKEIGAVDLKELQNIVSGIDSLIEMKPIVGAEVAGKTQRVMFEMRSQIKSLINSKLPDDVRLSYEALNAKYSAHRNFLDDIAKELDGGKRAESLVKRMMGASSKADLDSFRSIMETSWGKKGADQVINNLLVAESAKKFSNFYRKGAGGGAINATIGHLYGPQAIGRAAAYLSPNKLSKLKETAQVVEGMQRMPKGSLAKTPEAVYEIMKTVGSQNAVKQQVGNQLMQGAAKAIGGSNNGQ